MTLRLRMQVLMAAAICAIYLPCPLWGQWTVTAWGLQYEDTQNSLSYLDYYNTSTGSSAGIDLRLITENSANTGYAVVDIVKYRTGALVIGNSDSAGLIAFDAGGAERLRIAAN